MAKQSRKQRLTNCTGNSFCPAENKIFSDHNQNSVCKSDDVLNIKNHKTSWKWLLCLSRWLALMPCVDSSGQKSYPSQMAVVKDQMG